MTPKKLYVLTLLLCFVGYIWLFYMQFLPSLSGWVGCLFKKIYGIPCPVCGSTRAVLALINGNLKESIEINPFGLFVCIALLCLPVWILISILRKDNSFYRCYLTVEELLRKKYILIILGALLIINWFWNIKKGI